LGANFHESDFAKSVGYEEAEVRDHREWFVEMKPGYHRAKSWGELASWLLNGEAELDALKK